MTKNIFFPIVLSIVCALSAQAQKTADVYVDKNGVMRWGTTKKEVQGFGVNYTAPFAHAFRSAKILGVDLEKVIDNDVYHFSRLGFDAFRVHVWDTEISDSLGNLIDNEHFRLFDYMLMKMKERGIKVLLTPIAFWGNGYPDRDESTPGFSHKYGKDACLTNEDAIRAQENYLFQFLNHVNTYTKVAYKNDPDIVAFEVSNEPHHRGTQEEVTTFINRMVKSMRKTGCKKPIFYNISHSIHLSKAYFNADIQGGTFQWYPTGLGAQHELRGNFLPNVDQYTIPFASDPKFKSSAKVVYEFDAADIGRSYIYPAMARSFREAGIQWATHFAYDPTFIAYANTEYNTHYMNLAYAPQKALSLKLASEVFHQVPMYKNFGHYPDNATFDAFHLSYEDDLAEMVTDKKFIYTNTTVTNPTKPETLESISGLGNSSLVKYEGKGAYFLDKVEPGVWRLEVMPDAIWVDNIFGRNNLKKEVAVINWRT
nr:cellulase family glycosylhydrolase [Chryseolinea sp.]